MGKTNRPKYGVKKSQTKRSQKQVRGVKSAAKGVAGLVAAIVIVGTGKSLWDNHVEFEEAQRTGQPSEMVTTTTTTTEAPPATYPEPENAQVRRLARQMLANPGDPGLTAAGEEVEDLAQLEAAKRTGAYFQLEFEKAGPEAEELALAYAELSLLAAPGRQNPFTLAQLASIKGFQIGYDMFPEEFREQTACVVDKVKRVQVRVGVATIDAPEHPLGEIARDNAIRQARETKDVVNRRVVDVCR